VLSESVYGRVWHAARQAALSPELAATALARRPYDLRHAALSLWVNASGAPGEVAARAGNTTRVLHDTYLRCIDSHDDIISQRIEDALDADLRIASSCVKASGYTRRRHHARPCPLSVREPAPEPAHSPRPPCPRLSFVWTGDGRPDELTAKYAAGADIFVTECQPDLARLNLYKYGLPEFLFNYTVDIHHTVDYAAGYLMKQVNPRCGMVTHIAFDNDTLNETSVDIRAHWDGLFLYGAPDVVVVNVTKDAIWHRDAALPGFAGQSLPKPTILFGDPLPMATGRGVVPQPRLMREEQQEQLTRDLEIDPKKYYPPGVYREPLTKLADPQEVDLLEMAKIMGFDLSKLIK
jgi:hypothetical protein